MQLRLQEEEERDDNQLNDCPSEEELGRRRLGTTLEEDRARDNIVR